MTVPAMAAPLPATPPRAEGDGRQGEGSGGFAATLSTLLRPDAGPARTPVPAGGTGATAAPAGDPAAAERPADDAAVENASGEEADPAVSAGGPASGARNAVALLAPVAPTAAGAERAARSAHPSVMETAPEGIAGVPATDVTPSSRPAAEGIAGAPAGGAGDAEPPSPAAGSTTVTTQTGDPAGTAPAPAAAGTTAHDVVDGAAPPVSDTADVAAPETASPATEPGAVAAATVTTTAVAPRAGGPSAGPPREHHDAAGRRDATPAAPAPSDLSAPESAVDAAPGTVPVAPDAAPVAPVAASHVAAGVEATVAVDAAEPATAGALLRRPSGDADRGAPTAPPVVSRIIQLVERLRTEPPPQQLVVDLDQFGVGRLVISLRGDTVLVGAVDGAGRSDPQWWRELGEALDQRGWSLDGRREQPSHDRGQPQPQPLPSLLTRPRRRVHTDRGLRL